ncbi:MAG: dihydroorotate dehydrogenase electron transfer subunit [Pseudomonadota bacterium]
MNKINDQNHVMLRVDAKRKENNNFATLFFNHALLFKPGQFVMVWIPGIDEKPYTISYHSQDQFAITIEAKGIFSQKAVSLTKGDLIGIRGPFGNGFDIRKGQRTAVVAGGCGMAPLAALVEKLDPDTLFIHGARSKEYILYPDRFDQDRKFCTDDGSFGHKGFVTQLLENEIDTGKQIDMLYTCGPEIMMYNVFQICEKHDIPCQVSMERYMRCGFGVCGACVCGNQVVCKDGPVFGSDKIRKMKDFNTKALLKSGKDVPLNQYFSWRCK